MITGSGMDIGFGLLELTYGLVITYEISLKSVEGQKTALMRSTPLNMDLF